MKILVIESSPHANGASNTLAGEFMRGAREAGHEVEVFDCAHADIRPCRGCNACGMAGTCVQKDDMTLMLRDKLMSCDMAVFVTPLYYYNVSSQLKHVIDRFYSFTGELTARRLKTAFIVAAWDDNDWTMEVVETYYKTLCRYMSFRDQGAVYGTGCGSAAMTRRSAHMREAYELGRSLK